MKNVPSGRDDCCINGALAVGGTVGGAYVMVADPSEGFGGPFVPLAEDPPGDDTVDVESPPVVICGGVSWALSDVDVVEVVLGSGGESVDVLAGGSLLVASGVVLFSVVGAGEGAVVVVTALSEDVVTLASF